MAVKLDLKDRKILYELDKNARQPASKIASELLGLSGGQELKPYRPKDDIRTLHF